MYTSMKLPKPVFSFSISRHRLNDSALRQFPQKLRCPGCLKAKRLHHIRTPKDCLSRKHLAESENVICCLGRKFFLNVRVCGFNVRFFRPNVRVCFFYVWFCCLLKHSADMQRPVLKRMTLIQEKIPQENFKIFCRLINAIFQVIVICPDQRIPKISGMLSKNIICHIEAKSTEVLDKKYRRRSGIALTEHMDLPQSGYEHRKMMNQLIHGEISI